MFAVKLAYKVLLAAVENVYSYVSSSESFVVFEKLDDEYQASKLYPVFSVAVNSAVCPNLYEPVPETVPAELLLYRTLQERDQRR